MDTFSLSDAARTTAGTLLLTLVAVEFGGLYLLGVVRGRTPRTPFQVAFARAGHAHAGVLVTLSLVVQILADATTLAQPWASVARSGIPLAAILMPAGFFFASAGAGRTSPNGLIVLVYLGAVALAGGAVTLGLGLFLAPAR
jgi:hypothetical protein